MSCTSSNLIYVIICVGWGENYIGQTGDTLRHRMTVHRQPIREPSTNVLSLAGEEEETVKSLQQRRRRTDNGQIAVSYTHLTLPTICSV